MASTSITERFNELSALAACTSVLQILGELAKEASGKRYARTVEQRRERWLQLANLAEQQAQRTVVTATKRKPTTVKAAKPTTQPTTGCIALETAAAG